MGIAAGDVITDKNDFVVTVCVGVREEKNSRLCCDYIRLLFFSSSSSYDRCLQNVIFLINNSRGRDNS